MSNDERLRSAALDYADNGWRVIPLHTIERGACSCGKASCTDPGKHPRLTEWQHRASTDPDQIARWWRQWPNANVGIATGETSNLWVLDIDNKESVQVGLAIVGRGEQSLREMQQDHDDEELPATPTVRTGSGGLHFYFAYPPGEDLRNRAGIRKGVDARGNNGYVVAPPSIHASGFSYKWEDSPGLPALPPPWLVALAKAPLVDDATADDFATPFPEGERNTRLHSIGADLRHRLGVGAAYLYGMLQMHNHAQCVPPLPDDEVRRIAANCARYDTIQAFDVAHWNEQIDQKPPPDIPEGGDLTLSWSEFLTMEITPPPVLVYDEKDQPMLRAGTGMILAGPPGVGKTWTIMDLMISVAGGERWLGEYQAEPGPVLFVDEEGHPFGDQERLRMMAAGRGIPWEAALPLHFSLGRGIRLDSEVGLTRFRRMLENTRPKLVILDALVRFNTADENDARSMADFFALSKKLMDAYDTAFLFTHHVRKPSLLDADADIANIIRGTSEIRAWPDWIGIVTPSDQGSQFVHFHNAKQRWGEKKDDILTLNIQIDNVAKTCRVGVIDRIDGSKPTSGTVGKEHRIVTLVGQMNEMKEEATLYAIADAMGQGHQSIAGHLKKLVEVGTLVETKIPVFGKKQPRILYTVA